MELALRPDPTRLLVAGLAAIGAGLVALTPAAPGTPQLQEQAVQLTAGGDDVIADWQQVLATAGDNVQTLASGAQVASSELSQALTANLSGYGDLINTAVSGVETGLQNAINGGWYGSDDGFVFGLFGGSVTHNGVTETGSTLQEISTALQSGNIFNAFAYFDEWSLESLDHTMRPLLSPIFASHAGDPTIPSEMLQTWANLDENFFTYSFLKDDVVNGLVSPEISVAFGFTDILGHIATDVSSGNIDAAMTDLLKAPADLTNDLLNGFVDTAFDPTITTPDTALLNDGSLLDDLLVTWPTLLATALGESAATPF